MAYKVLKGYGWITLILSATSVNPHPLPQIEFPAEWLETLVSDPIVTATVTSLEKEEVDAAHSG
jgi:hypothetical protein